MTTKRVVISNIPYDLKWQEIKDVFRKEGNIFTENIQVAQLDWHIAYRAIKLLVKQSPKNLDTLTLPHFIWTSPL